MATLAEDLRNSIDRARGSIGELALEPQIEWIGRVAQVGDGVAMVSGLPEARLDELLVFEGGVRGLAVDLGEHMIGCMLLGDASGISAGSVVRGTGEVARVPVGEALLGRVVDALGAPLDGGGPVAADAFAPMDQPAPAIVDRALVTRPLATGLLGVDAMIPLGRGQRELIIGDRATGKTAIAVDTIINQRSSDVICVYAAVGQKASSVAQVIESVRRYGAPEHCLFVIGAADAAPGLQWLTPYAACAMAEYFMSRGRDVLLVIDDLTKHAAVYRQVSLLLRRPPGREAYPGDIFYIHSRLLERAAKLAPELGGGSLTALPIAETQAGNISAYIPTNLISITDGQIYLDPRLFHEDQKPAVDVGKSVSRVGGKTQAATLKTLSESLRLEYAQFLELEMFTRFGGMLDERTRKVIEHGRRIRAVLSQQQFAPLPLGEQVALLLALSEGVLDGVSLDRVAVFRAKLGRWLMERCPEIAALDDRTEALRDELRTRLKASLEALAGSLGATGDPL
ncbi:F0F1 ATP synthase subunit alpha [Methylocystis sp. L43]|jgi:F-type H+-transporting ATPase subunit alpha|uniref:F0F1 ATP synthase subunit alpha n=1 Tax=unclassified Methylocystis TaxID=2625913 RepID=UPI0018C292F4|nr:MULTISPECIES: F0F1 ATP synthase subunit alpha [unclassified Methylocystis]MBG0796298.1 F0F1 ATP synthase subunit alpha [Methylocystis sp. L43]MBG0804245.1 F0F1 ATP synthase subunit alpha [Methylocystis sp. H15]